MNTVNQTLSQLVDLRDTINLGIEVISQGVAGDDTITAEIINQIITDINTAWADFDLNLAPEASIDARSILAMLGLDPDIESVPEQTRLGFTVIPGGKS
jgi:hypothetical protein